MSVLLLLLSVASLKIAEPKGPILASRDFQSKELQRDEYGIVIFQAAIDPRGKVFDCRIEQVVNYDFGNFVCERVERTSFSPARDSEGRPAYGVVRKAVRFVTPKSPDSIFGGRMEPDLVVSTKAVPGLLTERRDVFLAVMVDSEGKVSACSPLSDKKEERLTKPACAVATQQWKGEILKTAEGVASPYVGEVVVEFEPEGAKP